MAQKFLGFRTQNKSVFPPERNLLLTPFQKTYSFGSAKILVNPKTIFAQWNTKKAASHTERNIFILSKKPPFCANPFGLNAKSFSRVKNEKFWAVLLSKENKYLQLNSCKAQLSCDKKLAQQISFSSSSRQCFAHWLGIIYFG